MSVKALLNRLKMRKEWKKQISAFFSRREQEKKEGESFILCDNLVKIYKVADLEVMALQGLELEIDQGDLMAIIGSSGSGKSTLLNILGGLDTPTAGRIKVAGWDLNNMTRRDKLIYRRETVGFVWQNIGRNLIPYLTALENVRLPMVIGGHWKEVAWAKELLNAVGLEDRMRHKPSEMSGGQQQRVAIAVALANRPEILLADEPTGSLDSKTGDDVLKVFRSVCEEYGITVIVVTHDRSLSDAVDRVVEIRDGKISTESIRQNAADQEFKNAKGEDETEDTQSHTKYTVLDSAGRLQIPEEYLIDLGIEARAALEKKDGRIIIRSPEDLKKED